MGAVFLFPTEEATVTKYVGMGVSLKEDTAYRLRVLAAVQGKTRSALIRELVETGLKRRDQMDCAVANQDRGEGLGP